MLASRWACLPRPGIWVSLLDRLSRGFAGRQGWPRSDYWMVHNWLISSPTESYQTPGDLTERCSPGRAGIWDRAGLRASCKGQGPGFWNQTLHLLPLHAAEASGISLLPPGTPLCPQPEARPWHHPHWEKVSKTSQQNRSVLSKLTIRHLLRAPSGSAADPVPAKSQRHLDAQPPGEGPHVVEEITE